MPHGTPDWWGATPQKQQHKLSDQAELAVRLGSANTYDRRGTTILQEGFERGLIGWRKVATAGDWSVKPTAEGSLTGGYSCELSPDPTDGYYAGINCYLRRPELGGCGLEVTFCANGPNLDFLVIRADVYDGSDNHMYAGQYDQGDGQVKVRDSTGTWQVVGNPGSFPYGNYNWIPMKLRFDTLAETYMNYLIGPRNYDASAYGPEVSASTTPDGIYVRVWAYVSGDNTIHPLIDSVILTQNEF